MVKFQCNYCKGIIESDGMASGEQVHCGHCEEVVVIPIPLTPNTLVDDFIIRESLGDGVFKCIQISLDVPVTDVIKGAVYHCGCNAPGGNDKKMLKLARDNYFAFITGTKDFNLNDTKGVEKSYKGGNFDNTKLIVVDGMGHSTPEAKVFNEAIEYLNTPLIEKGKDAMDKAIAAEKRKQIGEALEWYKKAAGFNVEGR